MPRPHIRFALRLLALLVIGVGLLGTAPAAQAGGTVLDGFGSSPAIGVDANGTGHLAWYTHTPAKPTNGVETKYFVVYCRLPRGATTCATKTQLPTPGNLSTFDAAQVVVDEGSSKIYLLGSVCCGAQEGIWAWTAGTDGSVGATPKRISPSMDMQGAALGPGPFAISISAETPARFHTGNLDGSSGAAPPIDLGAGVTPTGEYYGQSTAMLNSTTPFVVMTSIYSNNAVIRRFDSKKTGTNTAANWLPAQFLGSNEGEPHAVGGPSGAFVLTQATTGNPRGNYAVLVRRVGEDGTVGEPLDINASRLGQSPVDPDFAQDSSGRLHAVYKDTGSFWGQLKYQWSKDGATWGIPQVIDTQDTSYGYHQLGVGPDGGGWVVNFTTTSDNGSGGPIHIVPLAAKGDSNPPQLPAPTPAAGQPTPSPTVPPVACPAKITVSPAADAMVRSGPCFTDLGSGRFKTSGTVRVGGVDFVPKTGGGTLTIDTKAHTVETSGGLYETRAGAVVLAVGAIGWDLDEQITIADLGKFGTALLGLKLEGKADLTFKNKEGSIHVWLKLPPPFDGVRGETTVRTTMTDGLRLENIHLEAKSVPIGPIYLNNLDLLFTGGTNRFEGTADLTLPPAQPGDQPSIQAKFGMEEGEFRHLDVEIGQGVPPLPLTLFATPPVTLARVGLHVANDPKGFHLAGGVVLALGPELGGSSAMSIRALPSEGHGASLFVPKNGAYAKIGASGTLNLADFELAYGSVEVRTDGPITFAGGTSIDFGLVTLGLKGSGGLNLSNGDFYGALQGSATGFDAGFVSLDATGSAIVSSIGFAVCGTAKGQFLGKDYDESLGMDHKWGGDYDFGSCEFEAYKPLSLKGGAARLQAGGPNAVRLGAGLRGVLVKGASGAPGFTFAGPGGRSVTIEPGATKPAVGTGLVARPTGTGAVEVQVRDAAGDWTVTPAASGPTVTEVLGASERPNTKATARVAKSTGTSRRVTVTVRELGDQHLVVRELLPGGAANELGTVKRTGSTTLAFKPASGPGGRRKLEAIIVTSDGRQVDTIALGSYEAPAPPKLTAPKKVSVARGKSGTTLRWSAVPRAGSYRVRVKGSDGRLQQLPFSRKTTKTVLAGVTPDDRLDVTVSAIDATGKAGPPRKATSKGKALPKFKGSTKPAPKKKPAKKR